MNKLNWLLARLREPSTLAGLGVLVALFGGPAGLPEVVGQLAGGAAGALAILVPEKKGS